MVTRVRVDGLRQLGERMKRLSSDIALKAAAQATAGGARKVKKQAQTNIKRSPSVVTGTLHDAVIVKKLGKRDTQLTSEHIVTVRRRKTGRKTKTKQASAPHASFVEFGTVNMPAEPYLRPAIEQDQAGTIQAMLEPLRKRLAKEGV